MNTHVPFNDAYERWVYPSGWRPALEVYPARPSVLGRLAREATSLAVLIAAGGVLIAWITHG